MCLYERKLTNAHYLPNLSNKGLPPEIKDPRKALIGIGCGWCEECRKKLSNEWKIRLKEELKENSNAEYVTLSFSPESIKQIEDEIQQKKYKGIDGEQIDVNLFAAYAIRMFTERWRKKYRKAPRHFFVTELGHENSERLHIHGIMFNSTNIDKNQYRDDIEKKWGYGNVKFGKYTNDWTIVYISKYITKLDEFNKGYKQKIFVSQGLGRNYLAKAKRVNKFVGEQTNTKYTDEKGYKYELPRYYKYKIYTEEERDFLWTLNLEKSETYINKIKFDKKKSDNEEYRNNYKRILQLERERNENIGYGTPETNNKKYIITEIMKLKYIDVINYNKQKLIKCVERREIEDVIEYKETPNESINKAMDNDTIIYGLYLGTTTKAERRKNAEIKEARRLNVSIRKLRLIKAGII